MKKYKVILNNKKIHFLYATDWDELWIEIMYTMEFKLNNVRVIEITEERREK